MLNIFETFWPLLVTAIVLWLVITMIRISLPDKRRWWQLLLPVIVAAAAFGCDLLVKTDPEKIDAAIKTLITATVDRDIEQIAGAVSPDYSGKIYRSKAGLMAFCRRMLSQPLARKISIRNKQDVINSPDATVTLRVIVRLHEQNIYMPATSLVSAKVNIHFKKTSEKDWLVTSADLISVGNQPVNWNDL